MAKIVCRFGSCDHCVNVVTRIQTLAMKIIYQPNILAQDKIIRGLSDDVVCFCTCYEEIVFFYYSAYMLKNPQGYIIMKIMKIARMQLYKVPVVESRNLLKVLHHNQFSWDFQKEPQPNTFKSNYRQLLHFWFCDILLMPYLAVVAALIQNVLFVFCFCFFTLQL